MIRTPAGKLLIDKDIVVACGKHLLGFFLGNLLALEQRISQNREGKHIFLTDLRNNLHKDLLMSNQLFYLIDHIGAVWILNAAKQGFDIIAVKDGHVDEGRLVDAHKRLVKPINQFLEGLANIVIGIFDVIAVFTILFPEVIRPD